MDYELEEDRYDDVDFYETIGNESEDSYEEKLYEDEDSNEEVDEFEDEDCEECEDSNENLESGKTRTSKYDYEWERYSLNKTYPDKTFDRNKAEQLLYAANENGEDDEESQKEAIRYATYFAKKNNTDAKLFVISIIQQADQGFYNLEPGHVGDMAKYAFYMFFRNYVRVQVEKFYSKQNISDLERVSRTEDAIQECFLYIFANIDKFDVSMGYAPNTFFNQKVIRGAISDWEAARKGRSSKQSMRTDKMTVNAIKACEDLGIENPSSALIASMIGKNYKEVQMARTRIYAENTMGTFDTPDINNKGGTIVQEVFKVPEASVLSDERTQELIDALSILTDEEQTFLFMNKGIRCDGTSFIETDPLKCYEIAEQTGVDREKVQQAINSAIKKLKKKNHVKEKRGDALLSGRGLSFDNDEEDDFLDNIVDVH